MSRDYQKEKIALKSRNYWKPTTGIHKVKILTEPESFEYVWEEEGKEPKTIKKEGMKVEVKGKEYDWAVIKGITHNSLWGQLVLIAAAKGKLEGEEITLIVKGSGKEVSYTIEEALPLMVKEETVV
jgi:hypothetical protein